MLGRLSSTGSGLPDADEGAAPRTPVTADLAAEAALEQSPVPREPTVDAAPTALPQARRHLQRVRNATEPPTAGRELETAFDSATAATSGQASSAWQSPCCQTEERAQRLSVAARAAAAPSPFTATARSPSMHDTATPTAVSLARLTPPLLVVQHVREGSAPAALPSSTASSATASAASSRGRRSMTVALDQHPLAALSAIDGVGHNGGTGAAGPSALADPATPWPRPPMFATDLESPSRAPEREMQPMLGSVTGSTRPLYHDAPASGPVTRDDDPLGTSSMPVVHHNGVGAAAASGGSRSSANAALRHPVAGAATAVGPTPYPVTSTTSLQDWSSAPRLGFPAPCESAVLCAEAATQPQRDAEESKREEKWYRLCRGVSLLASAAPDAIVKLRAVAREMGIPHHLRGVMWLTLTGMALKVDENEYFCAQLLRRNGYVTGPNADAIAADVQRTFPGHPYFSDQDVGIYKLTNVLHALCWRNPLLSYCQSFNFLAAFLLLVLDDEERAFWLLVHIFESLLPNDFYGETLLGANVEQAVLEHLVAKRLPRVAAKFRAAGLQVHTLVANWIMSMFVNVFPTATTLRLWDYIFCRTPNPGERTQAHLEITLGTLKYVDEAGLLGGSDPDAGELLVALRQQTACLFDVSALLRHAQTLAITPAELHQLRRQCKPAVVEHMKAREQARAVQHERRLALELQHARAKAGAAATQS